MLEMQVRSLGWEDPLEKEMGTHSSVLAWRTPQTEEPVAGCGPRGHEEWSMTERLSRHARAVRGGMEAG